MLDSLKIKFDISDSSLGGHNFKFSTTKDGSHGGGSEFTTNVTTNGSPGGTGAYVQLEVTPETLGTATATGSTVGTLYYYCSSHSCKFGEASHSCELSEAASTLL